MDSVEKLSSLLGRIMPFLYFLVLSRSDSTYLVIDLACFFDLACLTLFLSQSHDTYDQIVICPFPYIYYDTFR